MNIKKENSKLDKGLYIKIEKDVRKQFSIKCTENETTMSKVIKDYINQYISK